ncbi:TetR family transcriptional regulator [Streptomyces sp. GQFP]|uniref:TetR family transcriptional regulator n=1 Tax=Streptomyces sp. GQFP TaxID=2907545 RepID=UPI001F256C67|nr:TetR family transcriptional regulator [Streptomyces sp. GQFP]UIX29394.1 TetR family transcriptional regulator [Streptomyces sp. GQFP]
MSEARNRPGKKGTATRARILDAAAFVFRMNGYVGTRLSDVAKVAKTQAGSMYYHFSSREDLVEEVLRVGQERTSGYVRRRVAALPEDATHLDRLHEAIEAHLATILEIGDYTAATIRILGQVPDEIRKRRLHEQREYGLFWRSLVDSAESAGEIRSDLDGSVVRMFLLGAMNSSPDWFRPGQPGLSAEQFERQCVVVFTEGVATDKVRGHRSVDTELAAVEAGRAACAGLTATTDLAGSAQRILDAAAAVFREKGYAGTRLVDVAEAAGIKTGSMYYHFDSREDLVVHLLLAAWKRTNDLVRESVNALPADAAPLQRLTTAIAAHLLSVLQSGAYTSALMRILGQVPEDVREQVVTHQRAYVDYWRQSFQDAVAAGDIRDDLDPSVTVMMLIGALNWAVEWYRPDGRLSPQDLVSQFTTLVFDGLILGTRER